MSNNDIKETVKPTVFPIDRRPFSHERAMFLRASQHTGAKLRGPTTTALAISQRFRDDALGAAVVTVVLLLGLTSISPNERLQRGVGSL